VTIPADGSKVGVEHAVIEIGPLVGCHAGDAVAAVAPEGVALAELDQVRAAFPEPGSCTRPRSRKLLMLRLGVEDEAILSMTISSTPGM